MAMDIRSKSGLHLEMGYGTFYFMRVSVLENMVKGFGNFYQWSNPDGPLYGIECRYHDDIPVLQLPCETSRLQFSTACNELLSTWLKAHGFGFAWRNFFCHSDCGGGWTPNQVKRLCKDLDRMRCSISHSHEFDQLRSIFHQAASRKEGLQVT